MIADTGKMQKQLQIDSIPDCKICKCSRSDKCIYDMGNWCVYRCTDCGFVFVYPVEGNDPNEPVDNPQMVITHHSNRDFLMAAAKRRIKELQAYFNSLAGIRILDIGCGNGYFIKCCDEEGMMAIGVEINQAAARYAEDQFSIPVIASPPPYNKFFSENSFDIITMWGVIEHLDDPETVVCAARNLLKNKGILVIQTPSEDATLRKVVHVFNRFTKRAYLVDAMYQNRVGKHIQCFSKRSITVFLSSLGFGVDRIAESTFGKEYMLKKKVFSQPTLLSKILKIAAGLLYNCSKLGGRQNHLLVFARKSQI